MWWAIFSFEIRYYLRQPLFYIAAAFLFVFGALLMASDLGVALGGVPANADRNAPILIVRHLTIFALLGLFLVTAYVTSSVLRDFESNTHPLFFSKPIRKFDYLTARFAGSMTVSLAVLLATAAGILAGQFAPWQDPEHIGPFRAAPYLFGLAVLVLPNLLSMGAILFAMAVWSRRRLVVYLGVIVYLFVQDFVEELVASFDSDTIASVVEPTGLVALRTVTRYWTVAETNVALPDLMGPLLLNRLLWLGLGLGILALGYWRFSTSRAAQRSARRAVRGPSAMEPPSPVGIDRRAVFRRAVANFTGRTAWHQWLSQTRLETGQVLKSIPFLVLFVLGMAFVFTMAAMVGEDRNMSVLPLTHFMLRAIRINTQMFLMAVVVIYAGELVWRERASRLDGVFDSLPAAGWVYPGAKLAALAVVVSIFVGAGILATASFQLISGFWDIEPGLYARGALVIGLPFVLLAVVSLFLQVVAKNKFMGFLLVIVLMVWRRFASALGLEHNFFAFGRTPFPAHSDMNGYGQYASPFFWFSLHWGFAAAILVVLTVLLWVRGTESSLGTRLARVRARWSRGLRVATAVAAVGWFATGAFIYYNTNVVNEYLPRDKRLQRRADYEIKYGEYRTLTLPRITQVLADVDMYPHERRVEIRGTYRLENKSDEAIRLIPLSTSGRSDAHNYLPFHGRVRVDRIDLPNHTRLVADEELGFYVYQLEEPLAPGQTMELGFEVTAENRGFKNNRQDNRIVGNGTFFANKNLFPALGYARVMELTSPKHRRDRDLPPAARAAAFDDVAARQRNYLDADWTQYETTLSTCADQIAIGPGRLESEWVEGNRRYFHYKTDVPMINFAVFTSAEYEVARDSWRDVAIEIYYHPKHPFNVDLLIDTTKESLDYFTTAFGPYPHSQIRILEVPNYIGRTAMSLSHTIPYSESWGFITRESDRVVDMTRYVTAHEVAHQWWNHQVIPADVQGATMIAEGLAEYSGLMVMKKMYGAEHMGQFLDYNRDVYLDHRGMEEIEEMPLWLVENQPYIHYGKASLVFYALQDYVGEEALNQALRRFLESEAFAGPPYATSAALLDYIRDVVPEEFDYLIEDMFETITLFDNRITDATCRQNEDDAWEVTISTRVRKLRSDGRGAETEIPVDDWFDIAVFGEEERDGKKQETVLYVDKRRFTDTDTTFGIVVEGEPVRVAIDPYHKHIDRVFKDNVRSVTTTTVP